MYNNISYEEYMQQVLGYTPRNMQDTFSTNDYYIMQTNNTIEMNNPKVCNECSKNTMPITNEILEQMTDNVFNAIDVDLKIETNVKIDTRKDNSRQGEDRQQRRRNNTLRDLIKILILNQILGGFPIRPPFPGRPPMPPRPPFPGGPRPR